MPGHPFTFLRRPYPASRPGSPNSIFITISSSGDSGAVTPSGANLYLFCPVIYQESRYSITSIKWNRTGYNQDLTITDSVRFGTGMMLSLYSLKDPAQVNGVISISLSSGISPSIIGLMGSVFYVKDAHFGRDIVTVTNTISGNIALSGMVPTYPSSFTLGITASHITGSTTESGPSNQFLGMSISPIINAIHCDYSNRDSNATGISQIWNYFNSGDAAMIGWTVQGA